MGGLPFNSRYSLGAGACPLLSGSPYSRCWGLALNSRYSARAHPFTPLPHIRLIATRGRISFSFALLRRSLSRGHASCVSVRERCTRGHLVISRYYCNTQFEAGGEYSRVLITILNLKLYWCSGVWCSIS